jgi:hypothetical protein
VFDVPIDVIERTDRALRDRGVDGYEVFVIGADDAGQTPSLRCVRRTCRNRSAITSAAGRTSPSAARSSRRSTS